MKKIIRIVLISIGVILFLLFTIPVLFKSRIETMVKNQVNQSIQARVDWSRFTVSLLSGFPDLSVKLHQVSVVGIEPFEGDTLAALKRFELRVNPFSAIRKNILVKAVLLDEPLINGIVMEDGSANWDIAADSETGAGGESQEASVIEEAAENSESTAANYGEETGSSMSVSLQRFAVREGRVFYKDQSQDVDASMEGFNLEISGDFSADLADLQVQMAINSISVKYGGIRYMKDGNLGMDLIVAADLLHNNYTLEKNEISLNGLVLGAEGTVSLMDSGAMDMDLRIFSRETSFQTLLSMVPAIYLKDFETLKTSGDMQLEGTIQGIMHDSLLPDAWLSLVVNDGYFAYPDLPKDVSDVQIKLNVDYKGTDMDATKVDLEQFHLLLGGNPFDLKLQMDHPISDMHVAGAAKGLIDFASLQDVVPLEEVTMGGHLEADLQWDTRISFIEQEQFEKVNLTGTLLMEDVVVEAPQIPVPVQLQKMMMYFTPKFVHLATLDINLGTSDLHMDGELTNFIPYLFNNQVVSGSLNVKSQLLDANELLSTENPEPETETDTVFVEAAPPDSLAQPLQVKIPENIDFNMNLDMKKLIYENIVVENMMGEVMVKEGVAHLNGLKLEVIEGSIITSGKVDTRGDFAEVDVILDMKDVDIPSAYETFVTVERLAPMARFCQGTANVTMAYQSKLDASFSPLYESINARGRVFTRGLQIYNLNSFVRLSELLKNEKFRKMAPDEVNLGITVKDGRIMVDPFDLNFDDSKIIVSGSHGIDLTMDYLMDMNIAKSDLGGGANELMKGITALASGAGFQIPESDYIKVKAKIKGTFNKPQISTDLSGNLKSSGETIKDVVEQRVSEKVEKVEEQVRDEAGEKADKMISDAELEAARLIEEARIAGEKLVKEAELQGERLVEEAGSNPLKKVAAKRAAEELVNQARKQSGNLMREAEVKAEEILEKARSEAAKI